MLFVLLAYSSVFALGLARCPIGAVQGTHADECYLYRQLQANWYQAEEECVTQLGHLASVHSAFANAFLPRQACSTSGTNTDYWTGASHGVINSEWSWTDGSAFTYANWARGEPRSNASSACGSVSVWNTQWYAKDCDSIKAYVCKVPPVQDSSCPNALPIPKPLTCPTPKPYVCPSGWTFYEPAKKCYKLTYNKNFSDSRSDCMNHGGDLASIHEYDQNIFIYELGQVHTGQTRWLLVGLVDRNHNRTWTWTDGTLVDYLLWAPTEPNNGSGDEWCTAMYVDASSTGLLTHWVDIACEAIYYSAACQIDARV